MNAAKSETFAEQCSQSGRVMIVYIENYFLRKSKCCEVGDIRRAVERCVMDCYKVGDIRRVVEGYEVEKIRTIIYFSFSTDCIAATHSNLKRQLLDCLPSL